MQGPTLSFNLTPPPPSLLDGAALFLDFDGTLVELAEAPDEIHVPAELGPLLGALSRKLKGRLALISGRGIADIDRYVRCSNLAVSGSHGLELRFADGRIVAPDLPPEIAIALEAVEDFARGVEGMVVEDKSFGVALHYRKVPDIEGRAQAFMDEIARTTGLRVQHGKMMTELRPHGADKGDAVRAFMTEPEFASARPVFVGDDLTDEHAFAAAAELGGAGVLVGAARPTAALWRLDSVASVARWLNGFADGGAL
ncbi:trehalose-phosphatase [Allosphingosinicella vermicomposti]|uniref:trehalose-phosphatase n=1 Tax=Allosphingosinicella vermicomposti TaxID=614671 RepID=UPI000D0F5F7F|nr:trehalose-phosphatase [Allosphingosinicella vermicomposti]